MVFITDRAAKLIVQRAKPWASYHSGSGNEGSAEEGTKSTGTEDPSTQSSALKHQKVAKIFQNHKKM